jgi:hypothetical protein
LDDERIDLAEPSFIPLAQDEAARAVRLLAVLIKAARSQLPDSPPIHPESRSSEDLADGSPPIPRQSGKVASAEAAGGGR